MEWIERKINEGYAVRGREASEGGMMQIDLLADWMLLEAPDFETLYYRIQEHAKIGWDVRGDVMTAASRTIFAVLLVRPLERPMNKG